MSIANLGSEYLWGKKGDDKGRVRANQRPKVHRLSVSLAFVAFAVAKVGVLLVGARAVEGDVSNVVFHFSYRCSVDGVLCYQHLTFQTTFCFPCLHSLDQPARSPRPFLL